MSNPNGNHISAGQEAFTVTRSADDRAAYGQLVTASLRAARHALAEIGGAQHGWPEGIAGVGPDIVSACSQLIAIANRLDTYMTAHGRRPELAASPDVEALRQRARRVIADHWATTGRRMNNKQLARALVVSNVLAGEVRHQIGDHPSRGRRYRA
jgi:hypothetical protein